MKRLALAMALGTAALVLAAVPASAQYPPERPTCRIDRTTVAAGDTATVSGEGWQADSAIDIDFRQAGASSDAGSATTGADGSFSTTITIPATASTGPATIVVSGTSAAGNPFTCRIAVTVTGAGDCARVDDNVVEPGQDVTVSSAPGCWRSRSRVRISFLSSPQLLEVATAGADGSLTAVVTIPSDATAGDHLLRLQGITPGGAPVTRDIPIEVLGARGDGAGLAVTGFAMWTFLILGVGLLATGAGLVMSARDTRGTGSGARLARQRLRRRAKTAFLVAGLCLLAWLLTAAVAPAAATALSLRHPVSPGTIVLALAVAGGTWVGLRARRASS